MKKVNFDTRKGVGPALTFCPDLSLVKFRHSVGDVQPKAVHPQWSGR